MAGHGASYESETIDPTKHAYHHRLKSSMLLNPANLVVDHDVYDVPPPPLPGACNEGGRRDVTRSKSSQKIAQSPACDP